MKNYGSVSPPLHKGDLAQGDELNTPGEAHISTVPLILGKETSYYYDFSAFSLLCYYFLSIK